MNKTPQQTKDSPVLSDYLQAEKAFLGRVAIVCLAVIVIILAYLVGGIVRTSSSQEPTQLDRAVQSGGLMIGTN